MISGAGDRPRAGAAEEQHVEGVVWVGRTRCCRPMGSTRLLCAANRDRQLDDGLICDYEYTGTRHTSIIVGYRG